MPRLRRNTAFNSHYTKQRTKELPTAGRTDRKTNHVQTTRKSLVKKMAASDWQLSWLGDVVS